MDYRHLFKRAPIIVAEQKTTVFEVNKETKSGVASTGEYNIRPISQGVTHLIGIAFFCLTRQMHLLFRGLLSKPLLQAEKLQRKNNHSKD